MLADVVEAMSREGLDVLGETETYQVDWGPGSLVGPVARCQTPVTDRRADIILSI